MHVITHLSAMSDNEDQKAKLNLSSNIDYYDTTDFAQFQRLL